MKCRKQRFVFTLGALDAMNFKSLHDTYSRYGKKQNTKHKIWFGSWGRRRLPLPSCFAGRSSHYYCMRHYYCIELLHATCHPYLEASNVFSSVKVTVRQNSRSCSVRCGRARLAAPFALTGGGRSWSAVTLDPIPLRPRSLHGRIV